MMSSIESVEKVAFQVPSPSDSRNCSSYTQHTVAGSLYALPLPHTAAAPPIATTVTFARAREIQRNSTLNPPLFRNFVSQGAKMKLSSASVLPMDQAKRSTWSGLGSTGM